MGHDAEVIARLKAELSLLQNDNDRLRGDSDGLAGLLRAEQYAREQAEERLRQMREHFTSETESQGRDSGWVPLEQRKPPVGERVEVCLADGTTDVGYLIGAESRWYDLSDQEMNLYPPIWAWKPLTPGVPLPKPWPKTGSKQGVATITYVDLEGTTREWRVSCHIDRDTEETMREHAQRFRPDAKVVSVRIVSEEDDV